MILASFTPLFSSLPLADADAGYFFHYWPCFFFFIIATQMYTLLLTEARRSLIFGQLRQLIAADTFITDTATADCFSRRLPSHRFVTHTMATREGSSFSWRFQRASHVDSTAIVASLVNTDSRSKGFTL